MIWNPVFIDNNPYYVPNGSFAMFIDYVVTDQRGVAIRQGQLNVSYKAGPSPPEVIDDCDILRSPADADPYNPEHDPMAALSTVKFRMVPSPRGTMLQYSSVSVTALLLRFKVSTLFHIPGDYVPIKNIGNISRPLPIIISAAGTSMLPIVQPMMFKNSGTGSTELVGSQYINNMGQIYAIKTDTLGNIYVCGQLYEYDTQSPAGLVKYNTSGELVWQRSVTQDFTGVNKNFFYNMHIDENDNIICVGNTTKSGTGPIQNAPYGNITGICIKFDSSGNEIFARTYVDTNQLTNLDVFLTNVLSTPDAIFVTGYMATNAQTNYKCFITRLDPLTGDIVWGNHLEGTTLDIRTDNIAMDSLGNVLQMGKVDGSHLFMRKYNAINGNVLWTKSYTYQPSSWWGHEVSYTLGPDDSIYITETEATGYTILMTKFTPNGDLVWQNKHGNSLNFYCLFGIATTFVTINKIFVVVSRNFGGGASYVSDSILTIMEFDLNGDFIRVRYLAFPSYFTTDAALLRSFATMVGEHIYIAFNKMTAFPDFRYNSRGVVAVPITWDGADMNFSNMLMVRGPIVGGLEQYELLNVDTTLSVTAITDPFATYSLTESVVPRVELVTDFQIDSSIITSSNPMSAISDVYFVEPNTPSGGNFWVNRIMMIEPDPDYNSGFSPYPLSTVADSAGNTYTAGWFDSYGIYGTDKSYLQKNNPSGGIEWFKTITGNSVSALNYSVMAVDETGIYTVERATTLGGYYGFVAIKYSLDGVTVLWHKRIRTTTFNMWSLNCFVSGTEFIVNSYTESASAANFLVKLDRATGGLTSTTALSTSWPITQKCIEDGLGNYYLIFSHYTVTLGATYGYVITKHVKATDAVIWQRAGYIDAVPLDVDRIELQPNFDIGPDGNLYVTATLADSRSSDRRFLAKYSPDGVLIDHKIYRPAMANGRSLYFGGSGVAAEAQDAIWVGNRLVCLSQDWSLIVDAFDANLVPIWGRTIYRSGENGTYAPSMMVKSGNDGVVLCNQVEGDHYYQYIMRIPIDGVFNFNGDIAFNLYDLTYTDITSDYVFVDTAIAHVTAVATVALTITNLTGASTTDYNLFNTFTSPI